MSIEEIRTLLKSFNDVEFSGPASTADISELRGMFSRPLPADYVEFLDNLGAGAVESEEFVGLGGGERLDARRVTARLREPSEFATFGEHLVPLSGDGGGNYDCIDLFRSTEAASVIVEWNHGGTDSGDLPVVEIGFWKWFLGMLDEVRDV
jgi:hypothetical protein